jgi:exodeoxyribonuclease VII small subunit
LRRPASTIAQPLFKPKSATIVSIAEAPPKIDFEAAMSELDELVQKMEQGEYSLEESLRQFERGMVLVRSCQQALRSAEQKVMKLAATTHEEVLEPFQLPPET